MGNCKSASDEKSVKPVQTNSSGRSNKVQNGYVRLVYPFLLPRVPRMKIHIKSQISFSKIWSVYTLSRGTQMTNAMAAMLASLTKEVN